MHVTCRSTPLCGLLLAASLAHAAPSAATNAAPPTAAPVTDLTTNAPIIVTASRARRTADEMPMNVTVITAAAIHDSGAQNVVEALEKLGGLYFRHNSDNPGQAVLSMHGFGENSHGRVLVLVDGQPLNTPDMANPDWLRIPVDAVERIEVLPGGQTALYGNDAVAGVVNIITHQPGGQASTSVSATVGSDHTFAGHIGHSGSIDDTVHYTADVDWRKSDGWRDNSDYDNTDVRGSITKDWTDRFSTDLAAFYSENRYGMPGYLSLPAMRQNPRQTTHPDDEVRTKTAGGSLGFEGLVGTDGHLAGTFAASHRTVSSEFFSMSSFEDTALDTYTFTPQYTLDADLAGHRNKLLTGIDLGFNTYDVTSFNNLAHTLQNTDATLRRANAGAYAQDEFWMTDKLALTLGARGEVYRYTADVTDFTAAPPAAIAAQRAYRQSALDAALLYRPTDQLRLFARAATLYRDPFVDELASTYGGVWGTPGMNLDLKPEIGEQYEVGSSLALDKTWTAALSFYRLDLQDEIAYNPITGNNSNIPSTRRYGADASLTWKRQDVGLVSLAYDYVNASLSSGANDGKELPLVPAHVVTVHGELDLPLELAALATARGVSSQYLGDDYGHESPRLPPYGTLDLGLRWRPHRLAGFELFAGVDNVFDHVYANSGYDYGAPFSPYDVYYPAAGRMWKVSASYRF